MVRSDAFGWSTKWRFRNTTRNLELVYSFPLPVGVTLLSFTVSLGERKYQGEVIPRAQA
ncbi:VIT domain-containing protein, partial [Dechloromonas sp.]|uniref:VIT domain-containing protein n=1 Tax=Dechloromonas sp. TaxID=1917218 RepID=UPI00216C8942|nr:hypothetical protein [Dechloromonas sp.]